MSEIEHLLKQETEALKEKELVLKHRKAEHSIHQKIHTHHSCPDLLPDATNFATQREVQRD